MEFMCRLSGGMVLVSLGLLFIAGGCSSLKSPVIGMIDGNFKPCPDAPACVSSQAIAARHLVAPIQYDGTLGEAHERLVTVLRSFPDTQIHINEVDYIYVLFKSALFGFIDDVEFYFDPDQPIIHLRSASRVGYSDLGANRKRVEQVRKRFHASVVIPE